MSVELPIERAEAAEGVAAEEAVAPPEELLRLHEALLFPRLVEEKMLILLRQGRLSKWFSGIGQEAIAVGVATALRPSDWILPSHRNLGVFTARGLDLTTLLCQLMGKGEGFTKGRERSFHFGHLPSRIVGMISHLGAMLPVACGLALAARLKGEETVAAAFTGDGASSEGEVHEAMNLAAVWKLPVLFVLENNGYGLSTPVSEQYACARLADRGAGYGMPAERVDGNDLLAVRDAVSRAAARARRGDGPTLLELVTFRMRGHEEASGTAYVPKELFEEWRPRDPVARFERLLLEGGATDPAALAAVRARLKGLVDETVERVLAVPDPRFDEAVELAGVHAPGAAGGPLRGLEEEEALRLLPGAEEVRYVDAVSDALRLALREVPRSLLLGQDVAEYGGAFKVTQGFVGEFGKERVRNTPIIEAGALGAALGLALDGFVPVVEMQFGDFVSCGFNQIVNNLAKTRYRWGAGVPVVVRCPVGGGVGAGPFHSQNVESYFANVPGLKIVAPATPFDAKGLLLSALEDGNPVLYLEHKVLYRSAKGAVPEGWYRVPIGRARLARAGRDATVVTWGVGVGWALDAAARLAAEGSEVEVVDLRSLLPWDEEAVLASVRRTGRLLVLHEATRTGGFGGEVAATVAEKAFPWLDAPPARLGALDTPVPFSRALEEGFSPKGRLLAALRELLSF